jgi:hypothetical protein
MENLNQTKKSKITKLTTIIVGQEKKWHKCSIHFENGDQGIAFYSEPPKLVEGDEITYSILNENGENKLKNVKKVYAEKPTGNSNGFGGGFKKNNAETDRRIAKQVSIKCSTDLIVAGKADLKDLFALSEKIYKYLNKLDD